MKVSTVFSAEWQAFIFYVMWLSKQANSALKTFPNQEIYLTVDNIHLIIFDQIYFRFCACDIAERSEKFAEHTITELLHRTK